MGYARAYLGYANFTSTMSDEQVASLLTSELFGGIRFLQIEVHEESDVGRLYLEHDFMGIEINLLTGNDGRFSVEIGTTLRAFLEKSEECDTVCDLSAMLKKMLANIPEITVVERFPDDVVDD